MDPQPSKKRSLSQSGDSLPAQKTKKRAISQTSDLPKAEQEVRVYFDGVFDLFHYGHMRALKKAKNLFPKTHLLVGVISDKETLKNSGKTVLTENERMEAVSHCAYVDQVVSSAWTVTPSFLKTYSIDYVVSGPEEQVRRNNGGFLRPATPTVARFPSAAALAASNLRTQFIQISRTEGISTSIIISRIVRDFDGYVLRNLEKGVPRKDMNISLFTEQVMKAEHTVKNVSKNLKMINDLQNFKVNKILQEWQENRVSRFLSSFGGKWLSSWSSLGFMKKISIFRNQKGLVQYPHSSEDEAASAEEEIDDPQLFKKGFEWCTQIIPEWKNISESQFRVTVIRGGLTNQLYKCSLKKGILSQTLPPPFPSSPRSINSSPSTPSSQNRSPASSPSGSLQSSSSINRPLLHGSNSSPTLTNPKPSTKISKTTTTPSSLDSHSSSSSPRGKKVHQPPTQVLMRIYGAHTDIFFDKEKENLIFQHCSDCGFGPKLYGLFEGGRLEEFIIAQTLQIHHLPIFSNDIGYKLAIMHHFEITELPKQPSLFDSLYSWLDAVRRVDLENLKPEARELYEKDIPPVNELWIELEALQEMLLEVDSPIVFCHNDLQEGNIMYDRENNFLRFIDFEYGNYNFRGFDFGNHFCEWQFSYAITEYPFFGVVAPFPTKEQQRNFLKGYLDSHRTILKEKYEGSNSNNDQQNTSSDDGFDDLPAELHEDFDEAYEIEKMYVETCKFSLASHFLWGLWGILQAASSAIEFGFIEYSIARFNEYFKMKETFFGLKPVHSIRQSPKKNSSTSTTTTTTTTPHSSSKSSKE